MSEINVVPYIDVMLVLLVIFMATAPLLTQGVEVDLPTTDSKPLPNDMDSPLVISIDADGQIFVSLGAAEKGTRATSFSLADQVGKIVSARPDVPVFLRGDRSLSYGEVVDVMTILQRAGAANVGLITDPPELVN